MDIKPKNMNNNIFNESLKFNINYDKESKLCCIGGYSLVYTCIYDSNISAVKIINIKKNNKEKILNEINIFKKLNNINIIKYYNYFLSKNYCYILQEYFNKGDLHNMMISIKNLSEINCKYYFKEICNGIKYMHNMKYIHRDIKLENIFINSDNNIKIGDFGFTIFQSGNYITGKLGTIQYVAPEIILEKSYNGFKSDIFSLGVLLFTMLYGSYPLTDRPLDININEIELNSNVLNDIKNNNIDYNDNFKLSDNVIDLLKNMLLYDNTNRYSINHVIKSNWLNKDL